MCMHGKKSCAVELLNLLPFLDKLIFREEIFKGIFLQ